MQYAFSRQRGTTEAGSNTVHVRMDLSGRAVGDDQPFELRRGVSRTDRDWACHAGKGGVVAVHSRLPAIVSQAREKSGRRHHYVNGNVRTANDQIEGQVISTLRGPHSVD